MPYDMYLNRKTGDWEFNSIGDLLGVSGDEFDKQRVWIRAKIPRGTFTYDETKTLGSTLYAISRNPSIDQVAAAKSALFTALDGITGIDIEDIEAVHDEVAQSISLNVLYSKSPGEEEQFEFVLSTGVVGTSAD